MSPAALWVAYIALGGVATFAEVNTCLGGRGELVRREHNTLTLALNEAFMDLGADHPIPYS